MKTLLKVYLYVMYIVASPVFLVFSAFIIIWNVIESIKDGSGLSIKEAIKAYAEGIAIGHRFNLDLIESACEDEKVSEEGV